MCFFMKNTVFFRKFERVAIFSYFLNEKLLFPSKVCEKPTSGES